jgi:putative glutamine amidotransferase
MALGLIEAMIDLGRPVFAVCRGFQEVNVAFGGTLNRDVNKPPRAFSHHAPEGVGLEGMFAHEHPVALTPDGVLARGLGRDRLDVNSVHYQGVSRLGAGLSVEAIAPDGLIEAVSARVNGAQILAVQWHPEWRTADNPDSRALFAMMGQALRGADLAPRIGKETR